MHHQEHAPRAEACASRLLLFEGQAPRRTPIGTTRTQRLTRQLSDRSTPLHEPLRKLCASFRCIRRFGNCRDRRNKSPSHPWSRREHGQLSFRWRYANLPDLTPQTNSSLTPRRQATRRAALRPPLPLPHSHSPWRFALPSRSLNSRGLRHRDPPNVLEGFQVVLLLPVASFCRPHPAGFTGASSGAL